MEIKIHIIIERVCLAQKIIGKIKKRYALIFIITDYKRKAYHLQDDKEEKKIKPGDESKKITHPKDCDKMIERLRTFNHSITQSFRLLGHNVLIPWKIF